MKRGLKRTKKICKNRPFQEGQNDISRKVRTKPMVSVFCRRMGHRNSDKESSHDVGKSSLRG